MAKLNICNRRTCQQKKELLFSSQRKNDFQSLRKRPLKKEFIPFHEFSETFTKSAKLLDYQYIMGNYFFMPLADAIPHVHLVEKVKVVF